MVHVIPFLHLLLVIVCVGIALASAATLPELSACSGIAFNAWQVVADPPARLHVSGGSAAFQHEGQQTIGRTFSTDTTSKAAFSTACADRVAQIAAPGFFTCDRTFTSQTLTLTATEYASATDSRVLTPGVTCYTVPDEPVKFQNTLTLDAQGDPNAVFIFVSSGSLFFCNGLEMKLVNGAQAANIMWVTQQTGYQTSLNVVVNQRPNGGHMTLHGTFVSQSGWNSFYGVTVRGRFLAGGQSLNPSRIWSITTVGGAPNGDSSIVMP